MTRVMSERKPRGLVSTRSTLILLLAALTGAAAAGLSILAGIGWPAALLAAGAAACGAVHLFNSILY